MVKKRGNFTGRAGRIGEQWNVIIEERGGEAKILVEDSTKDPSIFLGSILIEVKVTKDGMEGEEEGESRVFFINRIQPAVPPRRGEINNKFERGKRSKDPKDPIPDPP